MVCCPKHQVIVSFKTAQQRSTGMTEEQSGLSRLAALQAFGRRVREARIRKGLTQKGFADRLGVQLRLARRIEKGDEAPPDELRGAIAAALGADPATLFGDLPSAEHFQRPKVKRGSGPGAFNPVDVHVGARVLMRRMELRVSQERLADALGVSFQQIQKYERGANRIGASRLFDLSRVLGVGVEYFFENMPEEAAARSPGQIYGVGWQEEAERYQPNLAVTREAGELLGAYQRIGSADLRRSLIDLAKAMAGREQDHAEALGEES